MPNFAAREEVDIPDDVKVRIVGEYAEGRSGGKLWIRGLSEVSQADAQNKVLALGIAISQASFSPDP